MRAIDGDAIPWVHGRDGDVVVYPDMIAEMPTIEPERKTGRWIIYTIQQIDGEDIKCSECGKYGCSPFWNFCPECGADMRGF